MPLHTGPSYAAGGVRIEAPDPDDIRRTPTAPDVAHSVEQWLSNALQRDDVYYFVIRSGGQLVGQILLHDINHQLGESLVGYHLFQPHFRGRGIGTKALALLQRFVTERTPLTHLVIITSDDNLASQRIAQKCGFTYASRPREDQVHGVVYRWTVDHRPTLPPEQPPEQPRTLKEEQTEGRSTP